jgi:hypothetical protein
MNQRLTFCPEGFFIHYKSPNIPGHICTEFVPYASLKTVSGNADTLTLMGKGVNAQLSKGPGMAGDKKAEPDENMIQYRDVITQKWMDYRRNQGSELSELTEAIRHLPAVEIMGDAAQEAAHSFTSSRNM